MNKKSVKKNNDEKGLFTNELKFLFIIWIVVCIPVLVMLIGSIDVEMYNFVFSFDYFLLFCCVMLVVPMFGLLYVWYENNERLLSK